LGKSALNKQQRIRQAVFYSHEFFLQVGLNALADLTHEEFKQKFALGHLKFQRKPDNRLRTFSHGSVDEATLPQEIDWRSKNAVAEVKNQQMVGLAVAEWVHPLQWHFKSMGGLCACSP
jgi:hypothetical protein